MPTIVFKFTDPAPGGVDASARGSVRCALFEREATTDGYRSTREFVVPLVEGAADVVLSPGVWYVSVDVPGVEERWVLVPPGAGTIAYRDLVDVDVSTLPVAPAAIPRWTDLETRLAAVESGDGGGVVIEADPVFPWAAIISAATVPAITTQPQSASVGSGVPVTFTAGATGTPEPTVQWQTLTGSDWGDIMGATSSSYTVANPQLADSGKQYRAVFTNSRGSATTVPATLTVASAPAPLPVITGQPTPLNQYSPGADAAEVTASGSGYTSRAWQYRQISATTAQGVPGATGYRAARAAGWYDIRAADGWNWVHDDFAIATQPGTGVTFGGIRLTMVGGSLDSVQIRGSYTNASGVVYTNVATVSWDD